MPNRSVASPALWTAMRRLREEYGVIYALISDASGVKADTIRSKAQREGWRCPTVRTAVPDAGLDLPEADDEGHAEAGAEAMEAVALEEFLGRSDGPAELGAMLHAQVRELVGNARKGRVEKGRIDALAALMRLVERAEVLAKDGAQDQKKRSDDELAEVLERIDERIVELAEHHAERLVAQQSDAG